MIFITVDNDHTAELAKSIITHSQLSKNQFTIIAHPSSRNIKIFKEDLKILEIESHPVTQGQGYKGFQVYKNVFKHNRYLKQKLVFSKDDILIVTTEYQLNTAIYAKMVKKAGGRVYIFDEGVGFYLNNHPIHAGLTTFKDKLYLRLYDFFHFIMRVPVEARKGLEWRMFPAINSNYIDAIYVSMRVPIERKNKLIPYQSFLLNTEENDDDVVIFFAGNFDSFNLKNEEIQKMQEAMRSALVSFKRVYLKLHPLDWVNKTDVYLNYLDFLEANKGIELIDNNLTGNDAIKKFRPKVVVGTLSSALFDSFFLGCQPIFLFPLLPERQEFLVCREALNSLGYKFISSPSDVLKSYNSNVSAIGLTFPNTNFIFPE